MGKENDNRRMNDMLVKGLLQVGLLNTKEGYTLDIDATTILSRVKDAASGLKGIGFTPMVCMIGMYPVYVSMRSGNLNAYHKKLTCLKKCIELLRENGIKVSRVRIDGAGYQGELLDYLDSEGIKFVIGGRVNSGTKKILVDAAWERNTLHLAHKNIIPVKLTCSDYRVKNSKKSYRLIAMQLTRKHVKITNEDFGSIDKKGYRYVITNDYSLDMMSVINEYKERGTIEQNFAILKKDFGWNIVPFSKLNYNTVYLILSAFASNMYQGLLKDFSKKVKEIAGNIRLKTFKQLFIEVSVTYLRGVFTYFGARVAYEKLV